ncbi:MAG: hypothetical protein FWF10_02225 [Clostridiales bacterium]|nr:hypothetical protein [Clostridiales bacterium]
MEGAVIWIVLTAIFVIIGAVSRAAQKKAMQSAQARPPSFMGTQTDAVAEPEYMEGTPPHTLRPQVVQAQKRVQSAARPSAPPRPASYTVLSSNMSGSVHQELCAVEHTGLAEATDEPAFALATDANAIVQGMIWSEILNKPKALRRRNP